jgi:hypothetical protein
MEMCDEAVLHKPDAKRKCAVTVLGILASFGLATQFISASVNSCPLAMNQNAQCATAVSGFIAALVACANFATDLKSCEGVYDNVKNPFDVPVDTE